ncbi:MAG TPA: hypothetical protein VKV96_10085 [Roseiarcus sp.]|nr:hypothetical protein [Roseiarcus sp.]
MRERNVEWSPEEKKIARRAFEAARVETLAKTLAEFKRRASEAATPDDMWAVEKYLRQKRGEIDTAFDYRYSTLLLVFARLIRDGSLDEARLAGLSDDKLKIIRSYLSWAARD